MAPAEAEEGEAAQRVRQVAGLAAGRLRGAGGLGSEREKPGQGGDLGIVGRRAVDLDEGAVAQARSPVGQQQGHRVDHASTARKKGAVGVAVRATCSGVPSAITRPPSGPAPGPSSTNQSQLARR